MAAKKDTEEFEQLLVSSKVLEALFGVKDRTIRDLADKGIIKCDSHGKYLFWNSAKSYIAALKVINAGKSSSGIFYNEPSVIKRSCNSLELLANVIIIRL